MLTLITKNKKIKILDRVFVFAKIKLVNPPPALTLVGAGFFVMPERVFIIIDGNNFYHRLRELNLKNLLIFKLIKQLC